MANDKLSPRQELFCEHYAALLDAGKAAKAAGYSEKTAHSLGYQNLQKPLIQKRIAELREKVAERIHISVDMVVAEMWRLANCDISEAFDDEGKLKPIKEIPEDVRKAIAGVEILEEFDGYGKDRVQIGWTKKIRFWDKNKALDALGRHLGAFIHDKPDFNLNINIADTIAKARARAAKAKDEND